MNTVVYTKIAAEINRVFDYREKLKSATVADLADAYRLLAEPADEAETEQLQLSLSVKAEIKAPEDNHHRKRLEPEPRRRRPSPAEDQEPAEDLEQPAPKPADQEPAPEPEADEPDQPAAPTPKVKPQINHKTVFATDHEQKWRNQVATDLNALMRYLFYFEETEINASAAFIRLATRIAEAEQIRTL